MPIDSFVAAPDWNPAVDIRQLVQIQTQIDRVFKDRYGIPYYGGFPEISKLYEPHDASKLQMALKDLRGLTQWKYVLNKFDCSNMSALTQFYLANAGFKTLMVTGSDPSLYMGHAWVVVVVSSPATEAIPIEATTLGGPAIPDKGHPVTFTARGKTGTQSYNEYVTGGWAVQDIYQATAWAQKHFGETLGPDNEFNWWDTTQVDWSLLRRSAPAPTPGVPTPTMTPSALPVTPVRPAAVTITPQSASPGAIVTITGQGFTPNGTIANFGIAIGGMLGNTAPIFINAEGGFNYRFTLTSVLPPGACTVQVRDVAGRVASAVLTVTKAEAPAPPTLTVTPVLTTPGKQVTVTGRNFTPYATVESAAISFGGIPLNGPTFNVDNAGNIAFKLTISAAQAAGIYSIVVTDSAGKQASGTVTVTVPTPTPTPRLTPIPTPTTSPLGPPPVTRWYGTVKVRGANVPDGTVVTAWVNFAQVGQTTTTTYQGNSFYIISVTGDPATLAGKPVLFFIGNVALGQLAAEVGTWVAGSNVNLNLSYTAPVAIPTPTPLPMSVTLDGWYVAGSKVTIAVKGNAVTARIVLSGGSPGQYTMRILRDIALEADEIVTQTTFSYGGTSLVRELSFTPPYATNEASTSGYYVDLIKDGYVWGWTNAYPPRLRVNPASK